MTSATVAITSAQVAMFSPRVSLLRPLAGLSWRSETGAQFRIRGHLCHVLAPIRLEHSQQFLGGPSRDGLVRHWSLPSCVFRPLLFSPPMPEVNIAPRQWLEENTQTRNQISLSPVRPIPAARWKFTVEIGAQGS